MDGPTTWHHGIVAEWWSEFNDDFRSHELPYFLELVEGDGQPALDVACGTGRLLLPFLRAGLDVDGCDVSADMVAACRRKAEREGLSPTLWVQPMHELEAPRRYRTILVCGSFGLGSNRARDREALERFHRQLEPGGVLVLDVEVPYADPGQWRYWLKDERAALPEAARPPGERRLASKGAEYALRTRVLDLDPLEQHVTLAIHAERWRDGELEAQDEGRLDIGLYFMSELLLLLERAGFSEVTVHGEHERRAPTRDDDFLVFLARR